MKTTESHSLMANLDVLYVAELSANHNSSLERAHEILDRVADSGASAIKLQTYKPETMTLDIAEGNFLVPEGNKLWGGRSLFDLYSEAMTPWEWHSDLFAHARERKIIPFSSPFDSSAVDLLEELECPIYKIASFEIVDVELISYAARTGKPLIISTGMASLAEISLAVEAARDSGCTDLTLLKTTSAYPASPQHSNLATMAVLAETFQAKVGISDHTLGIGASIAAVALGAVVVEKHVTLERSSGGVDSAFSLEPHEFGQLVREANVARESVGAVRFGPTVDDRSSLSFRRSLYLTRDVSFGEKLTRENTKALRPGFGLPVSFLSKITGLKFGADFKRGTPVSMEMLS